MSHRARLRANLAAWALNSAVSPEEFNAFDEALLSSPDFDAGGIWVPANEIIIAGTKGIDMIAPLRALGAVGFNASMQAQNWPERATVTAGGTLNADVPIAWGPAMGVNGGPRYCAVGDDSKSYTSEDARTWTQRSSITAATSGLSADGVAYGLVGGGGRFLVLDGIGGVCALSADGISWAAGGNTGAGYRKAAYSEALGKWVIAGAGTIKTSSDCVTWTAQTVPGGWAGKTPRQVVWAANAGLFVIITSDNYNKLLTSPDGVTWTERTIGLTASWAGVAYSTYAQRWLLVETGGAVYRSTDGFTWVATTAIGVSVKDIACNQSLWVVPTSVGNKGGLAWSADAGATWSFVAVGDHIGTLKGYSRVIFADNRFVMIRQSASAIETVASLRSS